MELLVWLNDAKEVKYTFDLTPKELSDLKDELMGAIDDNIPHNDLHKDHAVNAILGTLNNFGIVIE